jgi:hypothetical protein
MKLSRLRAGSWAAILVSITHPLLLPAQTPGDSVQSALTSWKPYEAGGVRILLDPQLPDTAGAWLWTSDLRQSQLDLTKALHLEPAALPAILMVATRARLKALTGVESTGLTDFQTPALLFVYAPTPNHLAVRHELGHWLPAQAWRGSTPPDWIAEGMATWAQARCSGYSIRAAAATLAADGRLPDLTHLTTSFRRLPEAPAYLAAGSLVGYIDSMHPDLLQTLWVGGLAGVARTLETDIPSITRSWQEWLAAFPVADRPPLAAVAEACTQ